MSLTIEDLKSVVESNNNNIKIGVISSHLGKVTYITPRKNLKFNIQLLKNTNESGLNETVLKCEVTSSTQNNKLIRFEVTYHRIKSVNYADLCVNEFAEEYDSIDRLANKSK